MTKEDSSLHAPWPEFHYKDFQGTSHLLHMVIQAIGKLKLIEPFEPHWANVPLWLTSRGLTTGVLPYKFGAFNVDMDCINHEIICTNSWGGTKKIKLAAMSVAELTSRLFNALHELDINVAINQKPQEIPNPILFNEDTTARSYHAELVNKWWRIMLSTYRVLQRYHARFTGITPAIGLMWGTLDLRDARYKGTRVATTGENAGFIRRNAMDDAQVEAGWWPGNQHYPHAAFFSFTYPQPQAIETAKIQPKSARWDNKLKEFILDYDDLRLAKDPDHELLAFFETTYQAGAEKAKWKSELISTGVPA